MKNYEFIQAMKLDEMALMFWYLIEPYHKHDTKERKEEIKKKIRDFLNAEVKKSDPK